MSERTACVIPQPKQTSWREGTFALNPQTSILILPTSGEEEHLAARSLRQEILEATGLRLPIVKTARPARIDNVVLLVSDYEATEAFLDRDLRWDEELASHGQEAYFVDVTPQRVLAGGRSPLALHLAVQTLRQISRVEGHEWPARYISDWPSLRYRGLMLDVSRGKVPTLETLKLLVDQLSLYKANVLQLYTEHTFVFPHHPRIGQGCGSLDGQDILELDAYARRRHVELMPNLQSFGHCAHILGMPEYEHLAESAARWSLCPTDEATYAFLDDLYADFLPAFSSSTLNVGCDETWDLGKGRSAEAVAEEGVGRVYLEHIRRLHQLAKGHFRHIQLWGDILLRHPDLVRELPEDVTLLDWHYHASDDYPSVRVFAESGRPFWVCPGTSSWNALFPRIENANPNIRTLARLAVEHGAQGLLNTDWGDGGHYQPMGQCWHGYVYGAEQAWSGGTTDDQEFDERFGLLFFGRDGNRVVGAMRALARLNALPGMPLRNASRSIYALLDEPLVGETIEQLPRATLAEITRVCAEAQRTLRGSISSSRDPLSLEEMAFSASLLAYASRKVLASQQVRADVARLSRGQGDALLLLRRAMETFLSMDAELGELAEGFRRMWLRRARHSEIGITLGHFARLRGRFAAAREWLKARVKQLEAGEAADWSLEGYAEEAQSYEILGQSFRRRWRELGLTLG